MAARIEPERVQAAHQSLHHVVAKAEWDDAAVLGAVRRQVLPTMERHGLIAHWIVDDTGFPKQACRSLIAFTCQRAGPRTWRDARRRACRGRPYSRPRR